MAKSSRRISPGDSAPDFSHLADHDSTADETNGDPAMDKGKPAQVPSPKTKQTPPSDNPSAHQQRPEKPQPEKNTSKVSAEPPATSARPRPLADDGSHVFFDTQDVLSEEALAGETTESADRDDDPDAGRLPSTSAERQTPEPSPVDVDSDLESVLSAAPDADDPLDGLPAQESTGLTDIGFPSFDDPPEDAGQPEDEAAAASDAPPDETPAADDSAPPIPEEVADESAEVPMFPAADLGEGPPAPAVDDIDEEPTQTATLTESASRKKDRRSARSGPQSKRSVPQRPSSRSDTGSDRRRLMLILLASYASALTLASVWMWLHRNMARPHDLESLPDVAPLNENEFRYAPQNASMPNGHTLPLGSGQQLGYIKVEPLRVTRGPVAFMHYADAAQTKPPTEPVLKLWLRFTNVSSDQLIAPLDPVLLWTRSYQVKTDTVLANQLVLSKRDKTSQKPAYVLDHPVTSDWDLVGQQLRYRLKPGESIETYIPLEPGSDAQLTGDLLWRVHFRKGYHDQTGHGVTTMIEVPFTRDDVQTETSAG